MELFKQAIMLAVDYQLAPVALCAYVGVAKLLDQAERIDHAVELLALAEHHESSTFEIKKKAQDLLAEFIDHLPSAIVQVA